MGLLERPLISPQIENVFYKDDKLNISIKLYSTYNIYCNKNVVTNLIIENENKIYKHSGNITKDIFYCEISKNDLKLIKEDSGINLLQVEVSNTNGDIISREAIKGMLWQENELSSELNYDDDTLNLLISNKKNTVNLLITKDISINKIDEIQKYFSNLKILFKSEKSISEFMDENSKCNLSINNTEYKSNSIEIIDETSFYAYYIMENENHIVEKILENDVFTTTIIKGKNYRNKIDEINKGKIYRSAYEVFKLKAKGFFS